VDDNAFEAQDYATTANTVNDLTENLNNGEYIVDYRNGTVYGKKVSVTTTLASTAYKIFSTAGTVTINTGDVEL